MVLWLKLIWWIDHIIYTCIYIYTYIYICNTTQSVYIQHTQFSGVTLFGFLVFSRKASTCISQIPPAQPALPVSLEDQIWKQTNQNTGICIASRGSWCHWTSWTCKAMRGWWRPPRLQSLRPCWIRCNKPCSGCWDAEMLGWRGLPYTRTLLAPLV